MTWIKTIPPEQADEPLRKARETLRVLFPPEYGRPVLPADIEGGGIVSTHTLFPDVLYHAFSTFGSLMSPDLPLTRRQQEMIATVVSAANRCFYCRESHAEFLRIVSLDDALVEDPEVLEERRGAQVGEQDDIAREDRERRRAESTCRPTAGESRLRHVESRTALNRGGRRRNFRSGYAPPWPPRHRADRVP